jgi:small-conductance mechanosensitive channel
MESAAVRLKHGRGLLFSITQPHELFLQWLIFSATLAFCLWLSWDLGILTPIFTQDPSNICYIIALLCIGTTIHCGFRTFFISQQLNRLREIAIAATGVTEPLQLDGDRVMLNKRPLKASLTADYLQSILLWYQGDTAIPASQQEYTQLADILADRARGQHEYGWFISGLVLKLGLLGTIIGFVMMVGSISTTKALDLSDVQSLLTRMTVGMGVALNTTLAGLVANVLLSIQYLMLDRGADKLVSDSVNYAQTSVIPHLAKNA